MVRRTHRPLLQVRVSFETTRFSQQHLIEVYDRLAPTPQRILALDAGGGAAIDDAEDGDGIRGKP